ncbi:HPr-rel-A system PqqD family peptide chaperone [Candidatus Methylobacter favarea]|uniref:HPr-rel-A system PqqD family peptide chaperone n=1 Tax=Candidatus Methylobacter favarea TaxID=2707345 RepID=UPI00157D19CF|nr:HPr-rel-A system PqqD family peptide chaperone [Candidatus Methylobacter favarea]
MDKNRSLVLTHAGRELAWQEWDDVYIVYQPSSAETHVFNDTTAAVLQSLEKDVLTMAEIGDRTAQWLDLGRDELSSGDLSFALGRLEELGLIEWSGTAAR